MISLNEDIFDLRRYLLQSSQGEWLYVHEHDKFKVTKGFWDKCKVCIKDIGSGFSLMQRTREVVGRVLEEGLKKLPLNPPDDKTLFHSVAIIEGYQLVVNRCRLVWGRSIGPLPIFPSDRWPSLSQTIEKMKAIQRILPQKERVKHQQYQNEFLRCQKMKDDEGNRIATCLPVALSLKQIKMAWQGIDVNVNTAAIVTGALDDLPWCYKVGCWDITARSQSFDADAGQDQLDYIHASLKLESLLHKYPNRWGKEHIDQ